MLYSHTQVYILHMTYTVFVLFVGMFVCWFVWMYVFFSEFICVRSIKVLVKAQTIKLVTIIMIVEKKEK